MDSGVYPILVVDDEPSVLAALKRELKSVAPVYTATCPSEALEILRLSTISVIISDYKMPEKDGVTFLSELKGVLSYEPVKILLTAYSEAEIAIDAVNRGGIYYFVRKPWVGAELTTLVARALDVFKTKNELNFYKKRMLDVYNIKKGITGLIAHELNTPLLLVKGYSDLLSRELCNNQGLHKTVDGLKQGVERLEHFVSEIVEIAKIEAGQYSVTEEEFDLTSVVKGYFPEAVKGQKARIKTNRQLLSSALKRVSDYVARVGIKKEEVEINGDFLVLRVICDPQSLRTLGSEPSQPTLFFAMEPNGDVMHYNSGASNLELVYAATALKAIGYSLNLINEPEQTRVEVILSLASSGTKVY